MSSGFENLAEGLTVEEKRELLAKIQASLNLSAKDADAIVAPSDQEGELHHKLERDMKKVSFWNRILFALMALFTGSSKIEVFRKYQLREALAKVHESLPSEWDTSRKTLKGPFARRLYDLWADTLLVKPYLEHLFQQKLTLENGILGLIEQMNPKAPHKLTDLFPLSEMEVLYRQDPRPSSLILNMRSRLDSYLKTLSEASLDSVKQVLLPLYLLRSVVNYPYVNLFNLFGHELSGTVVTKYPGFQDASARKVGPYLERLFYGLYLANKTPRLAEDLFKLFQETEKHLPTSDETPTAEASWSAFKVLRENARHLFEDLPWKELLECCFNNPYYSLQFYVPQFSLFEFYGSILRLRFEEDLSAYILPLRERILESEKSFLFSAPQENFLEFYIPGLATIGNRPRLFRYPLSLANLVSFLVLYVQKRILPFIQSLGKYLGPGAKTVFQAVNSKMELLTALNEKILRFDRSWHTDTADGKEFQRLKYEASNATVTPKALTQFLEQKDAEAQVLLEEGIEHLQGLTVQLERLTSRQIPGLKAVLSMPYHWENLTEPIEAVLGRLLKLLDKGVFVVRESYALES